MEDFIFSHNPTASGSGEKWKEEVFFKTEEVESKGDKQGPKDFSFNFPEIGIPETGVFELSQEFLANISKIEEPSLFAVKPFEISFAPEESNNNAFLQTQPIQLTMELPIHAPQQETSSETLPSRLKVYVYHRPRKSLGLWQQVNESDAIRVTKGKGKWILVRVAANGFYPDNIFLPKISLIDLASNSEVFPCAGIMGADQSRLSNVASKTADSISGSCQEFKFKLDKTGATLQFQATFDWKGKKASGKSVVFSSQDSGKRRSSLKLKQLFEKKQNQTRSPRNSADPFFAKRTSSPRDSFNKEVLKKRESGQ